MYTLKNNIFIFIVSFIFCLGAEAQDILVKKDGSALQIKTEEISETTIKYRLWDDQSGPLRSISIESVLSINYANGKMERFNTNETQITSEQPVQVEPQSNAPSQRKDNMVNPTSVIIPKGTIIPVYSDMTFYIFKDFGITKPKELCLTVVKEDVIVDGIIAIPKGAEVYGSATIEKQKKKHYQIRLDEVSMSYILLSDGTLIYVDGNLQSTPMINNIITFKASSCTVKEDVTISLAD